MTRSKKELSKGWYLYKTDKSGKLCLDTLANHLACMDEHVRRDHIVTPTDVRKGETTLNNFSKAKIRAFSIETFDMFFGYQSVLDLIKYIISTENY